MHEVFIANELLELVRTIAADHAVRRVNAVHVDLGAMDQVSPEALRTAFAMAAAGTVAAQAQLHLAEVPVQARCRQCATRFAPALGDYACPGCGQADVQILEGGGIVLRTLECETEDSHDIDDHGDPQRSGHQ